MEPRPITNNLYPHIKDAMASIALLVEREAGALIPAQVNAFATCILAVHNHGGRIFLHGAGRSGLVARAFAMRLMHLGFTVYVIGEVVTPAVRVGDLVIVVSGTGETGPVNEMVIIAKHEGTRIAAVTSNKDSTLGALADTVVMISGRTETDDTTFLERQVTGTSISLTPLGTLFEINVMVFLDSVIAGLMEALGKEEHDLAQRHFPQRRRR
ncbi:MAG: 6-phospho-3-hexuloisomerase [Halobacteriota archaeon]